MPGPLLPPTTDSLFDDNARPYFLWWTDATVGSFKRHLASPDPEAPARSPTEGGFWHDCGRSAAS